MLVIITVGALAYRTRHRDSFVSNVACKSLEISEQQTSRLKCAYLKTGDIYAYGAVDDGEGGDHNGDADDDGIEDDTMLITVPSSEAARSPR